MTITVYIPSYNQREYLSLAVQSVLDQTRVPDQILIIDDASTDDSPDLIRSLQQAHPGIIDVAINPSNTGIGAVRQQAINTAKGDLITYLDGDDLYFPEKLELEERALAEHPDAGYAYTNFAFIDSLGKRTGQWNDADPLPSGDVFDRVVCFDFPSSILYRSELVRRKVLLAAKPYGPGFNLYEDYDAKLRIARHATGVAVDEIAHAYRKHEQGLHRVAYEKHYDTLAMIYAKNMHLLDGLDPARAQRLRRSIDCILADHAWRVVQQMARGQKNDDSLGVLHYARAAASHRPATLLKPKNIGRILRGLLR